MESRLLFSQLKSTFDYNRIVLFKDQADHQDTYRQIHIDIPRMSPVVGLFQQLCVQEIFERILFIRAIRHPASSYVQGMNDLVTPFFLVFLRDGLQTLGWYMN